MKSFQMLGYVFYALFIVHIYSHCHIMHPEKNSLKWDVVITPLNAHTAFNAWATDVWELIVYETVMNEQISKFL